MKLGCNPWSFHRSIKAGNIDQVGFIRKCADDLKLDGVELGFPFSYPDKDYIKKIKLLAFDEGLTIYALDASNNFGKTSEKERKREIEKVKEWLDIAYDLGAPILRIYSGWPEGDRDTL